jgi:hypothetical protein
MYCEELYSSPREVQLPTPVASIQYSSADSSHPSNADDHRAKSNSFSIRVLRSGVMAPNASAGTMVPQFATPETVYLLSITLFTSTILSTHNDIVLIVPV